MQRKKLQTKYAEQYTLFILLLAIHLTEIHHPASFQPRVSELKRIKFVFFLFLSLSFARLIAFARIK